MHLILLLKTVVVLAMLARFHSLLESRGPCQVLRFSSLARFKTWKGSSATGIIHTRCFSSRTNLYQELKDWRKRTADELQKPLYQVMNNKLLEQIVLKRPNTLDELFIMNGVGPKILTKYGRSVLDIVQKYSLDDDADLEQILEANRLSDTSFWDKYEKPKPKKKKKVNKDDPEAIAKATAKRRKRIEMLSESAAAEIRWPEIEFSDLNQEQQRVATHILKGNNVFLTGSAGTGKTFLLRYVIQEMKYKHGEAAVAVTAPTGIAAINIGGQTIHSFAGIGLGKGDTSSLIAKVMKATASVDRWKNCDVMIIDEISMLDKDLFESLDAIARAVKENDVPFGGIQIVVVGDFMQLPPVVPNKPVEFCFESPVWEACAFNVRGGTMELERVERQKDKEFVRYLNEVRLGIASQEFMNLLHGSCLVGNKPPPLEGIIPTKLYSINKEVDTENESRLQELPGEVITIRAEDKWKTKPTQAGMTPFFRQAVDNMIPEELHLKVGAQVMLLRNRIRPYATAISDSSSSSSSAPSLVNGSRGQVVAISESITRPGMLVPTVKFDNGLTTTIGPSEYAYRAPNGDGEIVRFQVPLKLAWAATIHKSQGCTLTCAELMLDRTFDFGQVYVALSRVKGLDGLWLSTPIRPNSIKANPKVLKFYGHI